jgi:hypothetical protein
MEIQRTIALRSRSCGPKFAGSTGAIGSTDVYTNGNPDTVDRDRSDAWAITRTNHRVGPG